nr:hypothetical protein [uncultured Allobaculum sp.]
MPSKKKANSGLVEDAVSYCEEVIQAIQNNPQLAQVPAVAERIHYLQEAMDEISVELEYSKEQDARVGHKTADSSFFGFKSHLAMTPERIITAAAITSGENTMENSWKNSSQKVVRMELKSKRSSETVLMQKKTTSNSPKRTELNSLPGSMPR